MLITSSFIVTYHFKLNFSMENNQQTKCYVTFSEKVKIFSYSLLKCCLFISNSDASGYPFSKILFSKLITSSKLMEDFLDFNGAKNNKQWFYYRELAASMLHLCMASYSQKHILDRLLYYKLGGTSNFRAEGKKNLLFLMDALLKIAPEVIREAGRLGIKLPNDSFEDDNFTSVITNEPLLNDIRIDKKDQNRRRQQIVIIASDFLSISRTFDQFGIFLACTLEEIHKIVPDKVNEVEIRRYEMLVHNLQSAFDTYVAPGGLISDNDKLSELRSHFSAVFHLLQLTGRLLHYYERHLHKTGYKNIYQETQEKLSSLVNSDVLLDRIVNYGLYYAYHYLSAGRELAQEVLNANINRSTLTTGIPVESGFHLRPSLLVSKIVQHYGGQVELCVGDNNFDASSVLNIQWAGGMIQKEGITQVTFKGDDRALKDIKILAARNYGEDTMGKDVPLPKELNYLR